MAFLWPWNRRDKGANESSILRWLPVFVAVVLMAVVAVVATQELSQLKQVTAWRRHSMQVLLAAQSFQNNLLDLQRFARDYVTTGHTNSFESFHDATKLEPEQFDQLMQFTVDNSSQRQRLKELAATTQNVLSYDERMIQIYKSKGSNAVLQADVAGTEGRVAFGRAREALKTFSDEEERLLDRREADEQSHYLAAERLLVACSILAAFLLIFANIVASRELRSRRRAEAQLHRALMLQKAILNSADYAIVTTNPEGIIQTFNPAAERLLGYSATEIIARETPMLWRDAQEVAERAQRLSAKLGMPVRPSFEAIAKKVQFDEIDDGEWTFIRKDGKKFIASLVISQLAEQSGRFTGYIGIFRDISARKSAEAEREKLIVELKEALAQVKTLTGLIPICGWCKSVRNDKGYWSTVEQYVHAHTDATFTHGMCPDCREKFKGEIIRANGGELVK